MNIKGKWKTFAILGLLTGLILMVTGYTEKISMAENEKINSSAQEDTQSVNMPNMVATDGSLVTADNPDEQVNQISSDDSQIQKMNNYENKFVVNTDSCLNIRSEANVNSDIVGKLYAGSGGDIVENGDEWTKITSGEVTGYVSNEFILTGEEAYEKLKEVGRLQVTVNEDNLRIRKEASEDSAIWGLADSGAVYSGVSKGDNWVEINYDGNKAFFSASYVSVDYVVDTAVTIEEVRATAAKEKKVAQKALDNSDNKGQYVETVKTSAYSVSESDVYLLSCLVDAEAGGEPYEGKLAVANIVLNRLNGGKYGDSLTDVIYAKNQFTVTRNGRLDKIMSKGPNSESVKAAQDALSGTNNVPDYTGFCTVATASYNRYHSYSVIGKQVFYNYK